MSQAKLTLLQKLPFYLLELLRTGEMSGEFVVKRASEQKHNFRKGNNKHYGETEDFKKVVMGTLYGAKMF